MRSILRYSAIPVGVMCTVIAMMIGVVSFALMAHVDATDGTAAAGQGRLITIHDRGDERVILTKATTVQEALDEADINLDSNDSIEPAVSEKLIASNYNVNIYRARPVIVADGVVRQKIMTPYQTADKIAEDAGLGLHDEDKTILQPTEDIVSEGAGLELKIDRATPFTFILYGKTAQAYTVLNNSRWCTLK